MDPKAIECATHYTPAPLRRFTPTKVFIQDDSLNDDSSAIPYRFVSSTAMANLPFVRFHNQEFEFIEFTSQFNISNIFK